MYSPVSTHDNYIEYPESEMDDRESLYFDTISLAGSEAANNRRSLSQSRMTIYHSAVDLAYDGTPKRNSRALDKNGFANYRNSAAALSTVMSNGGSGDDSGHYMDQNHMAANNSGLNDEVSSRLIPSSSCNKDKKLPITYSQWKSRVTNFTQAEALIQFLCTLFFVLKFLSSFAFYFYLFGSVLLSGLKILFLVFPVWQCFCSFSYLIFIFILN